jgi:hypothetical protein
MSQINTILIKRRLGSSPNTSIPSLSGGELAFSEKNNTLYYGGEFGTLAIAGSGAFVSLNGDQTISGNKTLVGTTTLSSITVSLDSLIDFGNNVLTNVAYPSAANQAATKQYVDDLSSIVAGDFVDRTNAQNVSGVKTFFDIANFLESVEVTKFVNASAYKVNGTEVITNDLDASFRNINASGNLTVQGDFTVLGNSTVLETTITAASAFSITNTGSGPALMVTQTGAADIAAFYDGDNLDTALIIKDGGNVGINTATPNERLTVVGNISASGTIYAGGNFEVSGGGANTTLYVEDGLVGINTETPNEALTVVGNISASQNIFGANGDFTGTFDVDGATTLGSTLYVTNDATFASSVSAAGALNIDGLATFNDNVIVVDKLQVQSTDFVLNTTGTHVEIEGSSVKVVNDAQSSDTTYNLEGITTVNANASYTIATDNGQKIIINANSGANDIDLICSNVNITTGDLLGNGTNYLGNFILDGGSF